MNPSNEMMCFLYISLAFFWLVASLFLSSFGRLQWAKSLDIEGKKPTTDGMLGFCGIINIIFRWTLFFLLIHKASLLSSI